MTGIGNNLDFLRENVNIRFLVLKYEITLIPIGYIT